MKNIVCFGECMVELRSSGGAAMTMAFGGDTLNTATYLARMLTGSFNICYATALGDDAAYSGEMLKSWHLENIDTRFVTRLPGQLPGLYTIQVDAKGERTFSYWRNDAAARKYFDAPSSPLEDDPDQIDVFYISGISLAILPPRARQRLFALMQKLHDAGKTIIFDNNYRPRLWATAQDADDAYAQAFALCDIALITLSDEAERLSLNEQDALSAAFALPCPEIVVKRGAGSTLLKTGAGRFEVPTRPVANIIDTTAAGDSFGAGYIAARLSGSDPATSAQSGNALAATVIQHRGAIIPRDRMPG